MSAIVRRTMESSRFGPAESSNAVHYFVDRHLREGRADRTAVLYGERAISYGRVAELVNRAANALRQAGIVAQDRVMLAPLDSPAFVAAFWGAIKLGAVPVPVSTLLTADDYEFVLADSGARGLIFDARLADRVTPALDRLAAARPPGRGRWGSLEAVLVASAAFGCADAPGLTSDYPSFDQACAASPSTAATAPTRPRDPAFWLYTSGSTGRPKAAVHLHDHMR
ncbi:MAG TPA: AMP-binding protein, partial [Terriglobia bacterium]|nr:AMP-binding protein [Terriglobia bacterium]